MSMPDGYVLALLSGATRAADCRRRRVGAVAVDNAGRVLSVGWNGLDDGSCLEGACPRGRLSYEELPPNSSYAGNCSAIHAEESALRATEKCRTLYVTEVPCPQCEVLIEDDGCDVVVVKLAPRGESSGGRLSEGTES